MKEKFLQFFTGKMSKSIYISIAAAVVCGAVVITSAVVVHDKNQQVDAVLESLSASESMTESVSESAEESVSESSNTESNQQAQAANNEPAGDKALQYLAEYDKLTAEYQAKRAELEGQIYEVPVKKAKQTSTPPKPERWEWNGWYGDTEEDISMKQKEYDEKYERELKEWEQESRSIEQVNNAEKEKIESEYASEKAKVDEAQRKLDALDAQYEKDVAALKAKYGIA